MKPFVNQVERTRPKTHRRPYFKHGGIGDMLDLGNGGWHSHDSRCQALSLPVRWQSSV